MSIPAHKTVIMIHCLATSKAWAIGKTAQQMVGEVRGWHIHERGWKDIAYAAIIAPGGDWAKGRDLDADGDVWEETGAGAKGWNRNVIHIALAGGHGASANDKFEDHFTPEQDATLRKLIAQIQREAGRKMNVMGHNEVANKGCPGFAVQPWLKRKAPRGITGSSSLRAAAGAAASGAAAVGTTVGQLDPTAQIVVVVTATIALLCLGWMVRERIKKWARGVQ